MITGDNPLTACHVARELKFTQKPKTLVLTPSEQTDLTKWAWLSIDQTVKEPLETQNHPRDLASKYDLCLTGEVRI